MRAPRALLASASALVICTVADLALACPVCAQKEYDGVGMTIAIAAMVVVPYLVALAIIRFIRNGEGSDTLLSEPPLPHNPGDNA